MRLDMAVVGVAVLLSLSSCSKSTPSHPPAPVNPVPAAAPSTPQAGLVTGRAAPGAIVVLEPKQPRAFPYGDRPIMNQVSLTFTPEMLFVRTGQPVEFHNDDDTLHNVHVDNADTKEPAFNVAIPTGEKYPYTFTKDGFYHVGCDIHPAMTAEILSVSTPFAMIAAADGSFAFAEVPPGAYRVRVHAAGVRSERDVDIHAGPNHIEI